MPGFRPMFSPLSPFGAIFPNNRANPGSSWSWSSTTSYLNHTRDVISMVPIFPGTPCYYTNSVDVMKQILGNESKLNLVKPQDLTLARILGDSLSSASGDVWRRHRRVVAPAFTNKIFSSVWKEARAVYDQMLQAEGWSHQTDIMFVEAHSFLLKFTFMIISKCGFGFATSWTPPESGAMAFPEALRVVSETIVPRMVLPSWAYKLPVKSLRRIGDAWSIVASFISASIDTRRNDQMDGADLDDASLPGDILNRLVASSLGTQKYSLSEQEVVANMFSLMFAGHETTASGLMSTFVYLALYQDEQDKAFQEVKAAFGTHNSSELIDSSQLSRTLACFLEAQRLCPAALFLPREMTEDVPIAVARPTPSTVVLKKGALMIFDLIAMFRNPHLFQDPDRFCPERWIGASEQEVGMFGMGPRACVGRKFAQVEALAILASFLFDWKFEPVFGEGETVEQYEERAMGCARLSGTAFTFDRVPLKLVKRAP